MKITHSQIINSTSVMTTEELLQLNSELVSIIRHRRKMESKDMKSLLSIGDNVWFDNRGTRHTGVVTKIMRTKAIVKVGMTNWKCTMSSLNFV